MGNILKVLSIFLTFAFALVLFTPSTTALATEIKQTEAQQLSNKIKQTATNSKVATINNNGKLIDIKKDNEGKPYVTEHNSDKALIDPNEIHSNSCNFWVQSAVLIIGLTIFTALALMGATPLLEFIVITLGYSFVYFDAVMLVSGILGGWSVLFLGQWIASMVCGTEMPKSDNSDKHYWDRMPKQKDSIPLQ